MDGVEAGCANQFECHLEVEVIFLNVVDETLEVEQRRMAFVAVEEVALDAEFLKHEHATYAEQIFLLDAVFPVAAVELMGDGAVEFGVHLEVGVHQIEVHAAYVDAPDVAVDYAVVVRNFENHGLTILVHHLIDGELIEVLGLVVGDLLTIDREGLREVAVAVEEADSGHGHA